jgi:hypothetical protein
MRSDKICRFISAGVLCLLLLAVGCGRSAKQTPVTKVEPEKVVLTKAEPEKTVETKVEPEKTVETKVEPEKTVETKVEPEKAVETKVEPEKTVETKVEPEKQKPTVKLALKFIPDDTTTYKVTTEAQKSVLWEGPLPSKPSAFKGGRTSNKIEMTFAQRIKSVNDQGAAVAEITIKQLKYVAKVRDDTVLDFDNSRERDQDSPLAKLIGQSYTIEITSSGQVLKVAEVSRAQAATKGSSPNHRTAQTLVSADVVKQRHTIPGLPTGDKATLSKGDKWSSLKTFNFGMMGSKSYERVYELKEIKDSDNHKLALVRMNAVPSSENAPELHKEQATDFLSKLFDNTEEYTGQLKLDLATGKIESYDEQLKSEWLAVDPESLQKDDKEPAALRMTALRLYQIERMD